MDSKLKNILKDNVKDMYRSLTMLDAALLCNSPDKVKEELASLKRNVEQCQYRICESEK